LSYQELHDWLYSWPALALACGLPLGPDGRPRVPSKAQQSKRLRVAGAPASELLFVLLVHAGLWIGLTRARDLIIDSAPILAWRRADPDAAFGHAPAHHPRALLLGYRLHTLLCRGTGLPLLFLLSHANVHDAPFARPLLELATRLLGLRPRVVRLDAGYWGLKLIAWIHTTLQARAVIPWNPKRQKQRDGLPPTWTAEELGKRTSIERFFGRILVFFRLQRPPVCGWSAVETRVALLPGYSAPRHPAEDVSCHPGFLKQDLKARGSAALLLGDVAVPVGCMAQDPDIAALSGMPLPAPTALQELRALVLGNDALDLHEEVILGGLTERAIEKDHLDARLRQFFQEHDLLRIVAR
jgi:transposase